MALTPCALPALRPHGAILEGRGRVFFVSPKDVGNTKYIHEEIQSVVFK